MRENVGKVDTVIRVGVGYAIVSMLIIGPKTMWGLLGLVPILTAAISYCPIYSLFGINTHENMDTEN